MKKIITLLTALACFFSLLILPAAAEESTDLLEQKLKETLELGALDFIQKPYTSEQIKQAVERIRRKVEENNGK